MNGLQVFKFDSADVRTVLKDGEVWFVGKDIAEALGYCNPQKAVRDHCRHAVPVGVNGSFTLDPQTAIVPEGDMYRLVVKSNLPSADRFEQWVMDEVLPTIRKTGTYAVQSPEVQLANAVLLAHKVIEEQKLLIADMTPKAEFFDTVTDSKDAIDIGTVAKVLHCGMGRTRLFQFLRDEKILMGNNKPYQQYIDCGYFRVIESSWTKPDGSSHVNMKTVVYQKGVDFIRKRLASRKK